LRRAVQLEFCPNLACKIIGVVYLKRKRKSFYYLIEPFALGGGPGLLFGSFAGKGYRLKSGQNL